MNGPRAIPVSVAARELSVSPATVYRWVDDGTLRGIRLRRPGAKKCLVRVLRSSLDELLGVDGAERADASKPRSLDELAEAARQSG